MTDDLISKKDLLELTKISYGQLYRWKRKGLIPESWFIRKATFTGQETFFPRAQILSRINRIKNMKEENSLDALADVFSPVPDTLSMDTEEIVRRGIATADVLKLYLEDRGSTDPLDFHEMLGAYIFNRVISSGDVSLDEGRLMLDVLRTAAVRFAGEPTEIFLIRKLGIFCCFAASPPTGVSFDRDTRLITSIRIPAAIEELKLKLL